MSKSRRSSRKPQASQGARVAGEEAVRAPRPVQSPRSRRRPRSRRALLGFAATIVFVAVAAVAGLLLARNDAAQNISLGGGQQIALPGEGPAGASASVQDLGPAPAFSIETIDGETFSFSPGDGSGPTVVSFIAGWCASCVPETIAGGEILRDFKEAGVRWLAVDADPADSLGQLKQFMKAAGNPPGMLWAMDKTSEMVIAYEVRALDTTVIIDRRGRIVYRDEWPSDYETLAGVLRQATS